MGFYIESNSNDPHYNLALEQYVFDNLDQSNEYIMLWQNDNSVIVGRNQNTIAEVNSAFVKEKNINVVRRLSGGGAVYHDLGNINFTFIRDSKINEIIFGDFCEPVLQVLNDFGVSAEFSGRNDLTIDGKKISGNAQYIKKGRVMHHGTLLYDSNLEMVQNALNAPDDKLQSKGIKSIKNRVTNIRPFMKNDMSANEFMAALRDKLFTAYNLKPYFLTENDNIEIEKIKDNIYSKWSWNYGASLPFNIRKCRRIEGCGTIEILIDVEKEGKIKNITFYGDFFGNSKQEMLAKKLTGCNYELEEIKKAIQNEDITAIFHGLDEEKFLSLLFE